MQTCLPDESWTIASKPVDDDGIDQRKEETLGLGLADELDVDLDLDADMTRG